jgi:hypothetical protein
MLLEPVLVGVGTAVLKDGALFLYKQAKGVLKAWRARRKDPAAPAPVVLTAPGSAIVGSATPRADAPSVEVLDTLQEATDAVELITLGEVDVDSLPARTALADLRGLIEAALGTSIVFEGEAPRPVRVADIEVVTQDVAGRVVGVRAALDHLSVGATFSHVTVHANDVLPDAEVIGVDLTPH